MVVNDNAGFLNKRVAHESIASTLAPTGVQSSLTSVGCVKYSVEAHPMSGGLPRSILL
jgi:hypothetical protein